MKHILLMFTTVVLLLAFPKSNFGQAPNLGTTSGFALFTASGAFDNAGASVITGDIGSYTYSPVGFPIPGTVVGNIYNVGAPILTSAAADAGIAFGNFSAAGAVLGTPLQTFNTTGFIYAGTYHTVGSADLNGDFTLDAQGDPNAIFVININGALNVGAGFNVLLLNSASLCNVYWQINGNFSLGAGSVFRGTIVSNGSITLLEGSSLLGRGITTAGAISLHNNVVNLNCSVLPAAVAGADRTITQYTSTQIGAADVPGSTFSWSSIPAGFTSTVANPIVTPMGTTTYTVVETITATGATNSHSVVVTVNPLPAAVAGADRTINLNSSTQIGAANVPGSTFSWSSVPAGFTSTVANPTVTPLVTTTYTVIETIIATSVSNSHSVTITVNLLPAAVAGANRTICKNTNTQIGATAVPGSTYSWTSVPAGFISNEANPIVSPSATTTYTVVETYLAISTSHSVVVTVNALPSANAGSDTPICQGETTQIGGTAVSGSTYSWTSVPAGFISSEANPTVSPLVTTSYTVVETITATGCSNSHSVVVSVSRAVAGSNRILCLNESTVLGEAAIPGSTYSWSSVPSGFTSNIANPTVSPKITTQYTLETTSASGCSSKSNVVVTVSPKPLAVAGSDRTICMNESTKIGSPSVIGSTFSWSSVPIGFATNGSDPIVTPLVTTSYTVVETIVATGCSESHTVIVTVNPIPVSVAGTDRIICLNESTTLGEQAIPGNTYSWSSVPSGFTSNIANPTVSPKITTQYTLETTSASGCSSKSNVVVTVSPKPLAVAGSNRAICMNESTQIGSEAVVGSTYSWSSIPVGFTSNIANPIVNPLVTTSYTVIETNPAKGCANANSVIITVNPIAASVAGAERTICQNQSTQIGAAAVAGSTYSWSSVPVGFTSSIANPTVTPLETTTYKVVETTSTGCNSSNSVVVNVNLGPAAIAGANRNICLNESTLIGAAAVLGNTYNWSSSPAGFTSTVANPTVNPQVTTTYTLVETNLTGGCQNTNSVIVSVNAAPIIIAEPTDQIACVGNSLSFSVTATGTDLNYQWRKGTLALVNGGNISGATSATLTIYPVKSSDAASDYNVVITGDCASNEISNAVSLTINAAPSISTTVCVGSSVSFSASATGSALTYQWRKGDVVLTDGGNITGATSAVLSINPVKASDASPNYNVLINGACSPDATSLNVGLIVNPAMNILSGPVNQTTCVGNSAVFSVTTEGTVLTYQWRKGTVNLTNGGNISGATSAILTINPVSAADVASEYNVVVTGSCSPMAISAPASLSLCIPTISSSIVVGSDSKNAVTIYPNPFTSSIDIKVNDVSKINNYELKIYNILGDEVSNIRITKDITTLETSNLPSGIYLYEVNSNNKTIQSGKLISQK